MIIRPAPPNAQCTPVAATNFGQQGNQSLPTSTSKSSCASTQVLNPNDFILPQFLAHGNPRDISAHHPADAQLRPRFPVESSCNVLVPTSSPNGNALDCISATMTPRTHYPIKISKKRARYKPQKKRDRAFVMHPLETRSKTHKGQWHEWASRARTPAKQW